MQQLTIRESKAPNLRTKRKKAPKNWPNPYKIESSILRNKQRKTRIHSSKNDLINPTNRLNIRNKKQTPEKNGKTTSILL
jgi:hypothetical protein